MSEPNVELWVDDHLVYEPGIVLGYLADARIPLDPRQWRRSTDKLGEQMRKGVRPQGMNLFDEIL